MHKPRTFPSSNMRLPYRWAVVSSLAMLTLLAGCGGGGGDEITGVGAGGTGAFAAGPITGFGSVIVNGVRYDDSDARIEDDNGSARRSDDLRLGMFAEVVSGPVTSTASGPVATASTIRYLSEMKGPIASIDEAGGSMVVLGQTVRISGSTLFEDGLSGGLNALAVGQVVEIHAAYDAATSSYAASRIEREDGASEYKLRGVVASLDTTARTFRIGAALFGYGGLATAPSTLADGRFVRVRLQTAPVAGAWVVSRIDDGVRNAPDNSEAEVEGLVSAFTSATLFSVDGVPVDASSATFDDGTAGLALGVRVEVEGRLVSGVLVARKVEIDGDDDGEGDDERIELHGTISSLDAAGKTFVVRGTVVRYAGSVTFEDGTEASLANGRRVEVKGAPSADGTAVQATRIDFES